MKVTIDLNQEEIDFLTEVIENGNYCGIQDFVKFSIQSYRNEYEKYSNRPPKTSNKDLIKDVKFNILLNKYDNIRTLEPPPDQIINDTLYGMWNRFFPIKIATRILANLQLKNDYVNINEIQEKAANAARELGIMISLRERGTYTKRNESLSIALPIGKEAEKSKKRFMMQFVGTIMSGKICGMPGTLRLINIANDKSELVKMGLTQKGRIFASLINPLLDSDNESNTLSEDEKNFLIDHINTTLPKESKRMRTILNYVCNDFYEVKMIVSQIKKQASEIDERKLLLEVAGILSRSSELGLLVKKSYGNMNEYSISEKGKKYLPMG